MRYLEVSIRCQRAATDGVGNLLAELTGGGYAVDDPMDIIENRAQWEITDLVPGDPAWVTVKGWLSEEGGLAGVTGAGGSTGASGSTGTAGARTLEETRLVLEARLDSIRALGLGVIDPAIYSWVQEEDWANAWKEYFKPTRVGERLVVIPSWESYELQEGDLPLHLDPGMAFGTGTHPTTALCLRSLEKLVKPGARVLDVGTGSGILAIAAKRLGAGEVIGIDVDPVAVKVAGENAAKNQVQIDVRHATLDQVEQAPADLIIANIIASIIIDIMPDVVNRMKSGSRFLASGIIVEKRQQVLDAMTSAWLLPIEVREEGGWVAIVAMKS